MKHIKWTTRKPEKAQINLGEIFTAIAEILQVVGTMLVTKQENTIGEYDW